MYGPKKEYQVTQKSFSIRDFSEYKSMMVVRPPYQRKSVWKTKKKQDLLDSLFRRYYIPRIVIREVRMGENEVRREVIDGQQRITTVQEFFDNTLSLPTSLKDLDPRLAGSYYKDLPDEIRMFADKDLEYDADLVLGIDDPKNAEHQRIAAEIFWRLQQGEQLTYMEIAHSRLASLTRNFVEKYADDITFDFERYESIDANPHKHKFFSIIDRSNDRMQHLALLTRFLIFETKGGPADIKNADVMAYIDAHQVKEGIGNNSFESEPAAKATLKVMQEFYLCFKEDPVLQENGGGVKELRIEYVILSLYLLLRHLLNYYVWGEAQRKLFYEFTIDFHGRWRSDKGDDADIQLFSNKRQQSSNEIEVRHQVIRQLFFEFVKNAGHELTAKDSKRAFSEHERIAIYRKAQGRCAMCLDEKKPDAECIVPWSEYDADHVIPHARGGRTELDNAQLLCRYHNQQKGARV